MKELWTNGQSDFKGENYTNTNSSQQSGANISTGKHFTMNDCKLSPKPTQGIKIIAAGQSARGQKFAAEFADYNFCGASGHNTPKTFAKINESLLAATEKSGRDVGAMVLLMVIADETDDAAWAKWNFYSEGVDLDATSWVASQATKDTKADKGATSSRISKAENPVNLNGGTLIGSFETVARLLDEAAEVPGTKGIMLTFDDFLEGMENFGKRIQPLMKCRRHVSVAEEDEV